MSAHDPVSHPTVDIPYRHSPQSHHYILRFFGELTRTLYAVSTAGPSRERGLSDANELS